MLRLMFVLCGCVLFVVYCVVCCLLFVMSSLFVACCLLFVLLFVVCCLLTVVVALCVVCCVLLVVCCSL